MTEIAAAPAGEDIELGEELPPWQRVRRNLAADRMAVAGGVCLVLFLLCAICRQIFSFLSVILRFLLSFSFLLLRHRKVPLNRVRINL